MNLLKQVTAADDALQMLQVVTAKGGQTTKGTRPCQCRQYWPIRNELYVVEGLVFKGETLAGHLNAVKHVTLCPSHGPFPSVL